MRNEEYYKKLYELYPDVVTLEQFRVMLGGIGYKTAGKPCEAFLRPAYLHDTQGVGNRVCLERPLC